MRESLSVRVRRCSRRGRTCAAACAAVLLAAAGVLAADSPATRPAGPRQGVRPPAGVRGPIIVAPVGDGNARTRVKDGPAVAAAGAILDDSEEAANLLKRANEAIERQDWKLAVDSLQRIIDLPGDSVLKASEGLYESARRHALRRIAALPSAGLQAYRLLYDGEADARFRHAVDAHDEAALQDVADRLLLTRAGPAAAAALAGWWLDEGRAAPAVSLLRDVLDICPLSDLPKYEVEAKLAVALAMIGQRKAAVDLARAWPSSTSGAPPLLARLEAVRRELPSIQPLGAAPAADAWPMLMGSPHRTGLMPAVEPTLIENSPWQVVLPRQTTGPLDELYEFQSEVPSLPVAMPVTDGRIVVVRHEGTLLAVDAETFEPLWQAGASVRPPSIRRRNLLLQRIPGGTAARVIAAERQDRARRVLLDHVEGAVALARNLAIAVVRSEVAQAQAADFGWRDGRAGTSRLVALDLRTGKLRWQCAQVDEPAANARPPILQAGDAPPARTDDQDDVEFFAPPVPVREELLAPCRLASDLYAIVLDPADGRVKRKIFLCGLGGRGPDPFEALHPCVADEIAYIPTNRGVLIALDTRNWAIRWAVRYETHLREPATDADAEADAPHGKPTPGQWICTPPLAVGGLVLLAPADSEYLLAFDRASAKIAWKLNRGASLYLLGADARHVWVAGPAVSKIDLESGQVAWTQAVGPPTGRGAISGNRLYLPTAEHVAVLDADTGAPIQKLDLPAGHLPFGNLLCCDGFLYACDLKELRRFPDMKRSYDLAQAAHQRSPADAPAAIRLAWLEMIKDQPARALAALDRIEWKSDPADARAVRLADHAAHLRVEALLSLAQRAATDAAQANDLLRRARVAARSPADAVRTGLALAERMRQDGKPAGAYREYAEIALAVPAAHTEASESGDSSETPAAPGDVMIDAAPGVRQPARLVIAARLVPLEKELTDAHRAELAAWLNDLLQDAARSRDERDRRRVEFMAEAGLLGDISARASLYLGILAQQEERNEEAEYHFREVARRRTSPELTAEALARLAALHLSPPDLALPMAAEEELRRLESEFAETPIPADAIGARSGTALTGAAVAGQLRRQLDPQRLARHRQALGDVRLGPAGRVAFLDQHVDAFPLLFRGGRPEALSDTLLLLAGWSEVRAHDVKDGRLLWSAALRLLDEPAPPASPASPIAVLVGDSPATVAPRPFAVNDGQVMIVNSPTGLHALGLVSGLRLWSCRYLPAPDAVTASDAFLAADRGNLIRLDADGVLTMASTIDGEKVRWQREAATAASEGLAAVRIRGEHVVAIARTLAAGSVYRTADGRHLGDVSFWQPQTRENRSISLALFDEVLCGPAGESEVAARELAAPGVERWRLRCEQDGKPIRVTGLFKPQPDLLGVGCEMGVVMVVSPATGDVLLTARTGLTGSGIFEGAITGDVLCLYGTSRDEKAPFKVVAVDARSGQPLWHRTPEPGEYWSQAQYPLPLENTLLRAATNAIPVARLIRPESAARDREPPQIAVPTTERPPLRLQLTILDKRTGRPLGPTQTATLSRNEATTAISQVLTWPDRVIVVCDSTYVAFSIDPPQAATAQRPGGPPAAAVADRRAP